VRYLFRFGKVPTTTTQRKHALASASVRIVSMAIPRSLATFPNRIATIAAAAKAKARKIDRSIQHSSRSLRHGLGADFVFERRHVPHQFPHVGERHERHDIWNDQRLRQCA